MKNADDFDEIAKTRTHAGSHRKAVSAWSTLWPFALAIILAPLLAWGAITLMSHRGVENPFAHDENTTADATPGGDESSDEPDEDPSGEASDPATDEPTSEEPTTEEPSNAGVDGVVYDAEISILNGTGQQGYAAQIEAQLAAEGYTGTTIGDYASPRPAVATIYFASAEFYDTAQNLAQLLQIDMWAESPGAVGAADIVIVLR